MNVRSASRVSVVLMLLPGVVATAGEVRLRAVTLDPVGPGPLVHLHAAQGASEGGGVAVKSFLNHEFATVAPPAGTWVITTAPARSSVDDPALLVARVEVPSDLRSGILLFSTAAGAPELRPVRAPGEVPGQRPEETIPPEETAVEAGGRAGEEPGDDEADAPAPPWDAWIIDDGAALFPAGSTMVLNMTDKLLRIDLEGVPHECPAQGRLLIDDQPVGQNNASGMRTFVQAGEGGDWVQVIASSWPHPGSKRVLQVIRPHPVTGQIESRGIRDIAGAP